MRLTARLSVGECFAVCLDRGSRFGARLGEVRCPGDFSTECGGLRGKICGTAGVSWPRAAMSVTFVESHDLTCLASLFSRTWSLFVDARREMNEYSGGLRGEVGLRKEVGLLEEASLRTCRIR